jgi:hypothetical protein
VLPAKFFENLWERVSQDHRRSAADSQTSSFSSRKLGNLVHCRIVFSQYLPRALQQVFTRFREDYVSRRSHKNPGPQFIFQLPDLHADCGLSDMHSQRSRRKGS